jgi:hypothetical protein
MAFIHRKRKKRISLYKVPEIAIKRLIVNVLTVKPAQIIFLLSLWMVLFGFSQLDSSLNHIYPGDVLIKLQLNIIVL